MYSRSNNNFKCHASSCIMFLALSILIRSSRITSGCRMRPTTRYPLAVAAADFGGSDTEGGSENSVEGWNIRFLCASIARGSLTIPIRKGQDHERILRTRILASRPVGPKGQNLGSFCLLCLLLSVCFQSTRPPVSATRLSMTAPARCIISLRFLCPPLTASNFWLRPPFPEALSSCLGFTSNFQVVATL